MVPEPGLYRVSVTEELELEPVPKHLPADDSPILLLLHGAASNTHNTFGPLWQGLGQPMGREIVVCYGTKILAFEHWGLSISPVINALTLAEALPVGSRLHILSLSQGGLIGELLCRSGRIAGPPIDETDLSLFTGEERKALEQLGNVLEEKRFRIDRFVRVACPVRGTEFPERAHKLFGRLSRGLGFIGSLIDKFPPGLAELCSDPERIPGFRASAPSSPLIRMLNRPGVRVDADLSIVAGAFRPVSLSDRLTAMALDPIMNQDNDLLVRTDAMFGGASRRDPIRFVFFAGPDINHFSYFERTEIVTTIVNRLVGKGGRELWRPLAVPLTVFLSYSLKDEPAAVELRASLEPLVQQELIRLLAAEDLPASGEAWSGSLQEALEEARIALVLVSPSFLSSEYALEEIRIFLSRAENAEGRIIPILVEPVVWKSTPLMRLQFVPKDGTAISTRKDREKAWQEVVEAVRLAVQEEQQQVPR